VESTKAERELHTEELHCSNYSRDSIMAVKSRRTTGAGHIARMGKKVNG
jgi:hypothetical protein